MFQVQPAQLLLLSFGKGFTAQFHQTSFHPNTVVSMDFWVNHKTFISSLSASLLFHSIYLFIYSSLLQIKDAAASSHSTSVTIMCEDHDCISPELIGHSPKKKKIYFEILQMCPSDYYIYIYIL